MEFSSEDVVYQYQRDKHLKANITIKNKQSFNQLFKFKTSTPNRFIIKPNVGSIEPGQECQVQISIHKQIVDNHENEKIQLIYGKNIQDSKQARSHIFRIRVEGMTSNLDLTTMLQARQMRVKQLQNQVRDLKLMPSSMQKTKKKSRFLIKLIFVIIIGLLIGFFGPLKIFKRKIIYRTHPQ